jgi:hypothetical protein
MDTTSIELCNFGGKEEQNKRELGLVVDDEEEEPETGREESRRSRSPIRAM